MIESAAPSAANIEQNIQKWVKHEMNLLKSEMKNELKKLKEEI